MHRSKTLVLSLDLLIIHIIFPYEVFAQLSQDILEVMNTLFSQTLQHLTYQQLYIMEKKLLPFQIKILEIDLYTVFQLTVFQKS